MTGTKKFKPDWTDEPPEKGSYRSIFKWGAADVFKHPDRRLYTLLKEKLSMTDADFAIKSDLGNEKVALPDPPALSRRHLTRFAAISGHENVFSDDYSRVRYGTGKTLEEALQLRKGVAGPVPDLVIHPRNRDEILEIVKFCDLETIPLVVYGGGSSVTLGLRAVKGGVSLVMSTHMNRVLDFSEINQTITVEPGIMGPALEAALHDAPGRFGAARRYTCGHFPQSFEYSTVGGWIAAHGSGQESSYYGDMCHLVMAQEYVTPSGTITTQAFPGTATGPKVDEILKGSEGAYGVLVRATLKIFRHMPEARKRFAFVFPDWPAAVNAAREISQGRFGMPGVFRISDPEETDVAFKLYGIEASPIDRLMTLRGYGHTERCLFIGSACGEKAFAANIKKKVRKICGRFKAMYLTGLPSARWERGRFLDPYLREDLNDFGIVIDTLESGVTWEGLRRLHKGVREFITSRPGTICLSHASHFYPQGTNLYFIFIARMDSLDEYRDFQRGIIQKIHENGGSLSHHHGVGKMIAPWIEAHLGKAQMDVLRALKKHFDPNNVMNPGGTLGLDVDD